jgi:3-hydroxyacyl-CoA dehydrogenase/enoyl-CoA hydratase/3-hydroxybutyryl-CoA epimerase
MVEQHGRFGKKNGMGFYDYGRDYEGGKRLWPGLLTAVGPSTEDQPTIDELRDRLLGIQALEAVRCLVEGVITDPAEGDVGAVLGWNFARWTGGPLTYIDNIGTEAFVARCDRFAERLGERFIVPEALRHLASAGGTVHGYNWDSR